MRTAAGLVTTLSRTNWGLSVADVRRADPTAVAIDPYIAEYDMEPNERRAWKKAKLGWTQKASVMFDLPASPSSSAFWNLDWDVHGIHYETRPLLELLTATTPGAVGRHFMRLGGAPGALLSYGFVDDRLAVVDVRWDAMRDDRFADVLEALTTRLGAPTIESNRRFSARRTYVFDHGCVRLTAWLEGTQVQDVDLTYGTPMHQQETFQVAC